VLLAVFNNYKIMAEEAYFGWNDFMPKLDPSIV